MSLQQLLQRADKNKKQTTPAECLRRNSCSLSGHSQAKIWRGGRREGVGWGGGGREVVTCSSGMISGIQAPAVSTSLLAVYRPLSVNTVTMPLEGSTSQDSTFSPDWNSAPCDCAACMCAAMHSSEARIPPCGWYTACRRDTVDCQPISKHAWCWPDVHTCRSHAASHGTCFAAVTAP